MMLGVPPLGGTGRGKPLPDRLKAVHQTLARPPVARLPLPHRLGLQVVSIARISVFSVFSKNVAPMKIDPPGTEKQSASTERDQGGDKRRLRARDALRDRDDQRNHARRARTPRTELRNEFQHAV